MINNTKFKQSRNEPAMRVNELKRDNIKDLLHNKGISYKEFADRIMVTRIAMEWYLDGSKIPKITMVRNMAVFLKCDINDIAVTESL